MKNEKNILTLEDVRQDLHMYEGDTEGVKWTMPYNFKGFYIQTAGFKGRYKSFAKYLKLDGSKVISDVSLETPDWSKTLRESRDEIEKLITIYREKIGKRQ